MRTTDCVRLFAICYLLTTVWHVLAYHLLTPDLHLTCHLLAAYLLLTYHPVATHFYPPLTHHLLTTHPSLTHHLLTTHSPLTHHSLTTHYMVNLSKVNYSLAAHLLVAHYSLGLGRYTPPPRGMRTSPTLRERRYAHPPTGSDVSDVGSHICCLGACAPPHQPHPHVPFVVQPRHFLLWQGAVGFVSPLLAPLYPVILVRMADVGSGALLRSSGGLCVRCKPGEIGELLGLVNQQDASRNFAGYTDREATARKLVRHMW